MPVSSAKSLLLELTVHELAGAGRAVRVAENDRALRKRGVTIRKTIDTFIATFCIDENHPLLFTDKDFEPFVEHLGLRPALGG